MEENASMEKVVGYTSGEYGNEITLPRQINNGQLNHLLAAIENVTTQPENNFVICEYGASNGNNSFDVFHTVIGKLKKRKNSPQQFLLIYQDQSSNNFNALFSVLEAKRKCELQANKKNWHSGVTSLATANTFHAQCVPDGMVHLGYSSSAMHWLSKVPCMTDEFPFNWTSPEIEDVWRKQAAEDWRKILELRDRELAGDDQSMNTEEMTQSVRKYVNFVRSWNEHTWYNSLSPARSQHERSQIVNELYSRYYSQVLSNPAAHGFDIVSCTVCISKEE